MLLAEALVHRFDPFLLEFSDGIGLRWYGLSYIAGFVIAGLLMRWMAATGRSPITREAAADLLFSCVVGVLIGGRLGYILFYDPAMLIGFSKSFPWWDVFALNKGGMASHGGILGVIVVCLLHGRRWGTGARSAFDLVAFACPLGLGLGRVANFVNGELWGEALPAAMQADPPVWSIKYPVEILGGTAEAQAAARDALGELATGSEPLTNAIVTLQANGPRADEIAERLAPHLTAYWPSQLFQALAEGPILFAALAVLWWRPRRPGLIGCGFMTVYGVLRIATERFRQPDEGIELVLGLSRGQWLSVAMIVVGLSLGWLWARRDVPPVGGIGGGARPRVSAEA